MAKVLIIGAGLGGLTLAHILHHNAVPFEIFERDTTTSSRKQGWAVALVESLPLLDKLLPPAVAKDLYTNSVNYNTGDHDEIGFVDSTTGKRVGLVGGVPHGQKGHLLRTSREALRNFLLNRLGVPVSMGKNFSHYTQDADSVTAFFKDGSSTKGTLLVGADGAHSHVLDQLIGASNHQPSLSEIVPIFGEVEAPKHIYEPIRALANAVLLGAAPKVRHQIGMLHMEEDRSKAAYFWALMVRRDDPKVLSDWLNDATREEVYDFACKTIEGLHPVVTDIITYGGPSAIVKPRPLFLEFVSPESLPAGRVTILGDAAHAMIPMRGAGANTAILDSCDLGQLLAKAWQQKDDFTTVLDPYLKIMLPRGRENVLSSRAAGQADVNAAAQLAEDFKRPDAPA